MGRENNTKNYKTRRTPSWDFSSNFDKPGPGVSPDAPRKKGAARFFEILGRDFSTIWMAGLLALISSLPFALLLWLAVSTHS